MSKPVAYLTIPNYGRINGLMTNTNRAAEVFRGMLGDDLRQSREALDLLTGMLVLANWLEGNKTEAQALIHAHPNPSPGTNAEMSWTVDYPYQEALGRALRFADEVVYVTDLPPFTEEPSPDLPDDQTLLVLPSPIDGLPTIRMLITDGLGEWCHRVLEIETVRNNT